MKLYLISFFTIFFNYQGQAQIGLIPLKSNPTIKTYLANNPNYVWGQTQKLNKWGTDDTLSIPFFDDFSSVKVYPDSSKWRNNFVYVNGDFGIEPPSYGVATFDYLNERGHPYGPLEDLERRGGDTLTSQAINLFDSSGRLYSLNDSFYLSFFYQTKGNGDLITEDDSLRLEFLDNTGKWRLAWSKGGDQIVPFRQVLIPFHKSSYLHRAFQFRFVNITHQWGNNNHWHLDYIYLNKNRNKNDLYYDDYAIQLRPTSLLKNHFSMPYDHFLADPSEAADSIYFRVSNRNQVVINAEVRYQEKHNGTTLVNTNFNDNAGNVPGEGSSLRKVDSYSFTGLSGVPVVIEREYFVRESGRTNPVLFQVNDKITVQQIFERYYAYDDGTAESGFGFNDLRNDDGQIVIGFDLKKADTLRAIAIHLTYNIQDLSKQRFNLQIWQDIAFNGGTDNLIYEEVLFADNLHTNDSVNGFVIIPLAEMKFLPKGKFYVGWSQDRNYNLGVGFDKNNGYLPGEKSTNKNIYYNIGDGWLQNSNSALTGSPMIRPIVGSAEPWSTSVENEEISNLSIYPNPASHHIQLSSTIESVEIVGMDGRIYASNLLNQNALNVENLASGIYFLRGMTENGQTFYLKFIKE